MGRDSCVTRLNPFSLPDVSITPPNIEIREFPLLSPQLLNYSMKFSRTLGTIQQWFQGFLDPVDFIITDPLGRRLGYTEALGQVNEIPNAFFSGDGMFEQFLIPNPVAGHYEITLFGLGQQVAGAVSSGFQQKGINMLLPEGEAENVEFDVELMAGAPGDANRDGNVNELDIEALKLKLNTFTDGLDDPCDLNGDGRISETDLGLLERLISGNAPPSPMPPGSCNISVTASDFQAPNAPGNTLDGNLNTRWSAQGDGQWIAYDLGEQQEISEVAIAWYRGDVRTADFEIEVSSDAERWTTVFTGRSSGRTVELQRYSFNTERARYVRIVGFGNSNNNWNSITEVDINGCEPSSPPPPAAIHVLCSIRYRKRLSSDERTGNTLDGNLNTRWVGTGRWAMDCL